MYQNGFLISVMNLRIWIKAFIPNVGNGKKKKSHLSSSPVWQLHFCSLKLWNVGSEILDLLSLVPKYSGLNIFKQNHKCFVASLNLLVGNKIDERDCVVINNPLDNYLFCISGCTRTGCNTVFNKGRHGPSP